MIRYALRCTNDHAFDSWFRDSESFDAQQRQGLVGCPTCGTTTVAKSLMAPSVVTSRRKAKAGAPVAPVPTEPAPVALLDDKAQKFRAMMREVRDHILATSQDVGAAFPEQARKMHEGEIEHRAIRGEASAQDVRALVEDGIAVMPVPGLPDDQH